MIVAGRWIVRLLFTFPLPSATLLAQGLLGPEESGNATGILKESEITELAGGAELPGPFQSGTFSNNGETGYVFLFNENFDVAGDVHLVTRSGFAFNCKDYFSLKSCAQSVLDAPMASSEHNAYIAGDAVFSAAFGGKFGTNIKDAEALAATLGDVRLMFSALAKSRDVNKAEFREFREQPSRFIASILIHGVGRGWDGRVVSVMLRRYEYRAIDLSFKDGKPRNYRIRNVVF